MAKRGAQALPGMEDRAIPELQDVGIRYAAARDERIRLNRQEVDLKAEIRALMKKHKKKHYEDQNVDINLEPPSGEEEVKVKVKKPKSIGETNGDDDETDDDDAQE